MRILLVTDWNRLHGGAEAYIGWLRSGLRDAGDDVRLLTSSAGSAAGGTADYVAYGSERVAEQSLLQIANPFAVRQLRATVSKFRPDVVLVNMFAHHLSPAILHALSHLPTVLSVSDYKCVCPIGSKLQPDGSICGVNAGAVCYRVGCVSRLHWLRDLPRYAVLRSGVKKMSRVLACSRWVQRELEKEGIASDVMRLAVPPPSAGYRRSPAEHPLFFFSGRLDREKGVGILLRAFAEVKKEVPGARLRIAGRGAERDRLDELARDLDLENEVTFIGWLEPVGIEAEMSRAWALVAPSVWAEPLGLVALEAVVRGVPVIASESGGFGETIEEGVTGMLVPNNNVPVLAARMLDIAHGRTFPSHRVPDDAVRRIAKERDFVQHVGRMREIFGELLQ